MDGRGILEPPMAGQIVVGVRSHFTGFPQNHLLMDIKQENKRKVKRGTGEQEDRDNLTGSAN